MRISTQTTSPPNSEGELTTPPVKPPTNEVKDEGEGDQKQQQGKEAKPVLVANPMYRPGKYHNKKSRMQLQKSRPVAIANDTFESASSPSKWYMPPIENASRPDSKNSGNLTDQDGAESPRPDSEKSQGEEELDEDVLYLRLIALRSMAPELGDAQIREEIDKNDAMEEEMMGLLEEADEAAAEVVGMEREGAKVLVEGVSSPSTSVIDVATSDNDSVEIVLDGNDSNKRKPNIDLLLRKLRNSLAKQEQENQQSSSVSYSPTQSPVLVNHADDDFSSGIPAPRHPIFSSPTPSPPSSPPLPASRPKSPLPPPPASPPPASPADSMSITVIPTERLLASGQPAPPGEDKHGGGDLFCRMNSISEPVDMELGSENEAEIEFFRHQKEENSHNPLFPQSVWGFGADTAPPVQHATPDVMMRDVMSFSNDRERYEAFLQAVVSNNQQQRTEYSDQEDHPSVMKRRRRKRKRSNSLLSRLRLPPPPQPPPREDEPSPPSRKKSEEDEDVNAMRAKLLETMLQKRELRDNATTSKLTEVPEAQKTVIKAKGDEPASALAEKSPTQDPAKKVDRRHDLSEKESKVPAVKTSTTVEKTVASQPATGKKAIVSQQKNTSEKRSKLVGANKTLLQKEIRDFQHDFKRRTSSKFTTKDVAKLEKNRAVQHAHFPNLIKKVFVPLSINTSDEEEEEEEKKKQVKAAKKPAQEGFASSLDQLLKEGRKQASAGVKAPPQNASIRKPVKRLHPHSRPKVTAVGKTPLKLSATSKAQLVHSSVKHLPPSKQREYRQLVAKLERMEKAKANKSRVSSPAHQAKTAPKETESKPAASPKVAGQEAKAVISNKAVINAGAIGTSPNEDNEARLRNNLVKHLDKGKVDGQEPSEGSNNAKATDVAECGVPVKVGVEDKGVADRVVSKEGGEGKNVVRTAGGLKVTVKGADEEEKSGESSSEDEESDSDSSDESSDDDSSDDSSEDEDENDGEGEKEKRGGKEESLTPEEKMLKEKETLVMTRKQELDCSVYKLSAEMSQLKDAQKKMEQAEEFVATLKRQLQEAEGLRDKKKQRFEQIREVVSGTHDVITEHRRMLKEALADCEHTGKCVKGEGYRLPNEEEDSGGANGGAAQGHSVESSAERIRQKLTSIAESAKQIKPGEKQQEEEEKDDGSESPPPTEQNQGRLVRPPSPTVVRLPLLPCQPPPPPRPTAPPPPTISSFSSSSSSFLAHMRPPAPSPSSPALDPHAVLCRYELSGRCNDDDCEFQHADPAKRSGIMRRLD